MKAGASSLGERTHGTAGRYYARSIQETGDGKWETGNESTQQYPKTNSTLFPEREILLPVVAVPCSRSLVSLMEGRRCSRLRSKSKAAHIFSTW
jgi:hypothetical protein